MGSTQVEKTKKALNEAKTPNPPPHISKKMKEFWRKAFALKIPQAHEVVIFVQACQAHDRAEQARRILKKEGLTYLDRFQQPRSRPEVAIERDNRAQFVRLLKQIHLHNEYWGNFQ